MNILRSLKGFYFLELSKSFFEPRVLTRLGRICLHPSQVTVGEKAWEALMSFPQGEELKVFELKVFELKVFGQKVFELNMRSRQKVGQQVLLWVAHVGKRLAEKADKSCVKRGQ